MSIDKPARSLGRIAAPYLSEIEARAKNMMRRFGGRIELRDVTLGRCDSAVMVVIEEPSGLLSSPGLADSVDRLYAGGVVSFVADKSGGYFLASARDLSGGTP